MASLMPSLFVVLCAVLCASAAHAEQWSRTYGDANFTSTSCGGAYAVQQTPDRGYVVAGTMNGDASVMKLDADGNVAWHRQWRRNAGTGVGLGSTIANAIRRIDDGGYLVLSYTTVVVPANQVNYVESGRVQKLDAAGNVAWQRSVVVDGFLSAVASPSPPATEGEFVVAGSTTTFPWDALVAKLDAVGNIVWLRTFGEAGHEAARSIEATSDGAYIVGGHTSSSGDGGHDAWVLKLDSDGNVIWQRAYGGPGLDSAASVRPTADGGYIVAGHTSSFGAGSLDAWLVKLDHIGNVVWQKTYGGVEYDGFSSVWQTADGGYLAAGTTMSFGGGDQDAWVLKVDPDGSVVSQRTYGGPSLDNAWSMQPTKDGGYIVAGIGSSIGSGISDAWLLKIDGVGGIAGCALEGASSAIARGSDANGVATSATAFPFNPPSSAVAFQAYTAATMSRQQCLDTSPAQRLTAVEYLQSDFGHYFITAAMQEIAALDVGAITGWRRTGLSFQVYGLDPGAANVCRFWSDQAFVPKSSHFYTPLDWECERVKGNPDWKFEGEVFAMQLPIVPGPCRVGTMPLFRLFNDGRGGAPNHRYTTSLAIRSEMVERGWIPEGHDSLGIVGCVPVP